MQSLTADNQETLMKYVIYLLLQLYLASTLQAQSEPSKEPNVESSFLKRNFLSEQDHWPDATYWLLSNPVGFVPIPFYLSDSVIGKGWGLGLLFLKPQSKNYDPISPETPDLYLLLGFKTENDTWAALGGYRILFKNDKFRLTGFLGRADVGFNGYYTWGVFVKRYLPFDFDLISDIFIQKLQYELGGSQVYVGLGYSFFKNKLNFSRDSVESTLSNTLDNINRGQVAAMTLMLTYDSRDSIFSPDSGIYSDLSYHLHRKSVGGDYDFDVLDFLFLGFTPVAGPVYSSFYFDYKRMVRGDYPFYLQPSVNLRGVPILGYQGDNVFASELELRWDLWNRLSILGFGGVGATVSDGFPTSEGEVVTEYGGGLRYLLSRPLKMRVGLDVAWGPSNRPIYYFQFGNAWILQSLL